jgi:hypothetical protein
VHCQEDQTSSHHASAAQREVDFVFCCLPAFILGKDPTQRTICASYAQELSAKFGRDTRAAMQTSWYQRAFPATRLSPEKQTETELMTTARGFRFSTSVGGVLTGRGGNFIIVDDPMKPEDAVSDSKRAQAVNWFDGTLTSRLDDEENGVMVVVMQRLQVDDLAGHVLAKDGYVQLNLPAIAEEDQRITTGWGNPVHAKRANHCIPACPKRSSTGSKAKSAPSCSLPSINSNPFRRTAN